MKRKFAVFLSYILFLTLFFNIFIFATGAESDADSAAPFELTSAEKEYLASVSDHVFTFAYMDDVAYFSPGGEKYGMLLPLYDFIQNKLGLKAEFVKEDWTNAYTKLNANEIDFVSLQSEFPGSRNSYFSTLPICTSKLSVVTRESDPLGSILNLYSKKIGMMKNSALADQIRPYLQKESHYTYFDSADALLLALENSEIDVALSTAVHLPGELIRHPSLNFEAFFESDSINIVIYGNNRAYKPLIDIINRYLQSSEGELLKDETAAARTDALFAIARDYYKDDIAYLKAKYPSKIVDYNTGTLYPFSFVENGEYKGFLIDINKIFTSITGLEIEFYNGSDLAHPFDDMIELMKKGEIQFATGGYLNPTLRDDSNFTYSDVAWSSPMRMYSFRKFDGDFRTARIGTTSNAIPYLNWTALFDQMPIIYESRPQMIEAVKKGEIDAVFMNELTYDYCYNILGEHNLRPVEGMFSYAGIHFLYGTQNEKLNHLYDRTLSLINIINPESRLQWEQLSSDYKLQFIDTQNKLLEERGKQTLFYLLAAFIVFALFWLIFFLFRKYRSFDRQISKLIMNQQSFDLAWGNIRTKKISSKGHFPLHRKWKIGDFGSKISIDELSEATGVDYYSRILNEMKKLERENSKFDRSKATYSHSDIHIISKIDGSSYYYSQYLHRLSKYKFMIFAQDITDDMLQKEALLQIADTDFLSKLMTRRAMDNLIKEKSALSKATNQNFYITMFDIDNFKKVNDTYGHDVGDEVLKLVADYISKTSGFEESTSRWGGEEFVAVFEAPDIDIAVVKLEAILKRIASARITTEKYDFSVTVSAGVALLDPFHRYTDSINLADEALYKAKSEGKNCVRIGLPLEKK